MYLRVPFSNAKLNTVSTATCKKVIAKHLHQWYNGAQLTLFLGLLQFLKWETSVTDFNPQPRCWWVFLTIGVVFCVIAGSGVCQAFHEAIDEACDRP
jgi:hypothetical protein